MKIFVVFITYNGQCHPEVPPETLLVKASSFTDALVKYMGVVRQFILQHTPGSTQNDIIPIERFVPADMDSRTPHELWWVSHQVISLYRGWSYSVRQFEVIE